jgi:hypothetical protein
MKALVNNDAPKAKSGHLWKDKTQGGALTGCKESGWLAEENEAKLETDTQTKASWRIFLTLTLRWEKSKEVSSCGSISHTKYHQVWYCQNRVARWSI